MKTTILNLLLVITLLSSCNTARNYANYRVGGKSKKVELTLRESEPEKNSMTKMNFPEPVENFDTTIIVERETVSTQNTTLVSSEKKKNSTDIKYNKTKTNRGVPIIPGIKNKKKNSYVREKSHQAFQKYGTDTEDVLYFVFGALLIAGGILALIAAGVTVAEIIIFGLGFIGVLILFYLIGEAFMKIFPGMLRKNKRAFSLKNIFAKILPSRSMKYYGGMTIGEYFRIGLLVILIAGLFTLIFSSFLDAVMVATLLFSIHLGISLVLCIGYGLAYICTGGMMNFKK